MHIMLTSIFLSFRENTYVRVVGHLKSFKENSRSLIAFGLSPVTDFNEITYHMLDVIHSHLALKKVMFFFFQCLDFAIFLLLLCFVCFKSVFPFKITFKGSNHLEIL